MIYYYIWAKIMQFLFELDVAEKSACTTIYGIVAELVSCESE